MKKRTLTLLEVMIATLLVGILCTGLFQLFHQSLRKQIEGYQYKQYALQLSLFEQNCKQLFSSTTAIFSAPHPHSKQEALFFQFTPRIDPEPTFSSLLNGSLSITDKGELAFNVASSTKSERKTLLIDHLEGISFRFFSNKTRKWQERWSEKMEELPSMLEITLIYNEKQKIPFVFLMNSAKEPISYTL